MSDENLRIITINGVKMEIDLRTAKTVDQYRVGDTVKVLQKGYGETYASCVGVIVGLTEYKELPTIDLLVIKDAYGQSDIHLVAFNAKSKDIEIAPMLDIEVMLNRDSVLEKLDADIAKAEELGNTARYKKRVFVEHFGNLVDSVELAAADARQ